MKLESENPTGSMKDRMARAVIERAEVVEHHAWLIDPASYFEDFNTRLHGIDEDTVAQSPEFDEVWRTLAPVLDGERQAVSPAAARADRKA